MKPVNQGELKTCQNIEFFYFLVLGLNDFFFSSPSEDVVAGTLPRISNNFDDWFGGCFELEETLM